MNSPLSCFLILLNLLFLPNYFAQFSPSFREFLKNEGGQELEKLLTREDLGAKGSYGGGNHKAREKTKRLPVILVHGITASAAGMEPIRKYFKNKGYGDQEIFATTYGDAGKTKFFNIRLLIQAVSKFTSNKVNINSNSLGTVISRKAILGGKCVDTKEDLGPPLTDLVHTYVGVAGPHWGAILCFVPIGPCNINNGVNCLSTFLRDINIRQRYEGTFIYSICSTDDEVVGFDVCGRITCMIEGENAHFPVIGVKHLEVISKTIEWQYNLITFQQIEGHDE
uniref:Lipase n=1 Tax=Meloidogyne floridensis TaxID=298350 RepID=A0A915PFV9_9BILA